MPKKALDTNKPRGPVSAYALFVQTCRTELKRKYPQLTVDYNVIVKKCSERWKAMNENEKRRFNDTAELHRKRYKEELANYQQEQQAKQQQQQQSATSSILLPNPSNPFLIDSCSVGQLAPNQTTPSHSLLMPTTNLQNGTTLIVPAATASVTPIVPPKKPPRKRKPKDPHAPKKPLSAYFLFCADERPKVHGSQSGMSVSDVARELGVRWKQAPVELKSKYEQAASEKKDVYKAELALYKNQTSTSSSPPETSPSPPTPHDFPSNNHPIHSHLNQVFQSQDFHPFDMNENHVEFDMMTNGTIKHENDN